LAGPRPDCGEDSHLIAWSTIDENRTVIGDGAAFECHPGMSGQHCLGRAGRSEAEMELHAVAIRQQGRQGERADEAGVGEAEAPEAGSGPLDGTVSFGLADRRGKAADPTHRIQDFWKRLAPPDRLCRHDQAACLEDQEQISERRHGVKGGGPRPTPFDAEAKNPRLPTIVAPRLPHQSFGGFSTFRPLIDKNWQLGSVDQGTKFSSASNRAYPRPWSRL